MSNVHRIAVPNPFFEGRNSVYLIDTDPLTLIDSGVATGKAFQSLLAGLADHGCQIGDVRRVILTHKHIDHIGNAWRIQRESNAQLLIHESEQNAIEDVDPSGQRFSQLVADQMQKWKVPQAGQRLNESSNPLPKWELESAQTEGLSDGQRIPLADGELEVIHTPGHTMGSICLRYGSHLFTGDHVLQDVSSNVGGGDMRHTGMLSHFISSLDKMLKLSPETKVLPGHGAPFQSLHERCIELKLHHDERLEKTTTILSAGPRTVYEVARELFGEMDGFHIVLGCAEANAHLELLMDRQQVSHDEGSFYRT